MESSMFCQEVQRRLAPRSTVRIVQYQLVSSPQLHHRISELFESSEYEDARYRLPV
jgi:hypothetical protein